MNIQTKLILAIILSASSFSLFSLALAIALPYMLGCLSNPEVPAPLSYWFCIPLMISSFALFELSLRLSKDVEKEERGK